VLVRAFGWLIALRSNGLLHGWLQSLGIVSQPLQLTRNELGVVIGMVHFMVPFALFPLVSTMRRLDPRVLLAARGGAGQLRTFWSIFVPQTLPDPRRLHHRLRVLPGFFITPAILGGGQTVMVAEYVYLQMFQTSNWGLGAALSVVLLALVAGLIWALLRMTRVDKLVG
jgi:putative spermidine/putrescine transport system permease protein